MADIRGTRSALERYLMSIAQQLNQILAQQQATNLAIASQGKDLQTIKATLAKLDIAIEGEPASSLVLTLGTPHPQ